MNRRWVWLACVVLGPLAFAPALPFLATAANAAFESFPIELERESLKEVEEERTATSVKGVASREVGIPDGVREESSKEAAAQEQAAPDPLYRFHVQVAAVADRAAAMALAKRLAVTYRYTTVVDPIEKVGRKLYRVRLRVETRAQAEALAERLRKEESFKPWIVEAD